MVTAGLPDSHPSPKKSLSQSDLLKAAYEAEITPTDDDSVILLHPLFISCDFQPLSVPSECMVYFPRLESDLHFLFAERL